MEGFLHLVGGRHQVTKCLVLPRRAYVLNTNRMAVAWKGKFVSGLVFTVLEEQVTTATSKESEHKISGQTVAFRLCSTFEIGDYWDSTKQ